MKLTVNHLRRCEPERVQRFSNHLLSNTAALSPVEQTLPGFFFGGWAAPERASIPGASSKPSRLPTFPAPKLGGAPKTIAVALPGNQISPDEPTSNGRWSRVVKTSSGLRKQMTTIIARCAGSPIATDGGSKNSATDLLIAVRPSKASPALPARDSLASQHDTRPVCLPQNRDPRTKNAHHGYPGPSSGRVSPAAKRAKPVRPL